MLRSTINYQLSIINYQLNQPGLDNKKNVYTFAALFFENILKTNTNETNISTIK